MTLLACRMTTPARASLVTYPSLVGASPAWAI
nr:MAG TPA: hypothetical protein [Caudoviricetes sp.]